MNREGVIRHLGKELVGRAPGQERNVSAFVEREREVGYRGEVTGGEGQEGTEGGIGRRMRRERDVIVIVIHSGGSRGREKGVGCAEREGRSAEGRRRKGSQRGRECI